MMDNSAGSNSSSQSAATQRLFVGLLARSHDRLLAYLMSLLGNRQDAEDVLQRSSMLMWEKFDGFDPETDFIAWATSVCFYEARNFQRVSARDRLQFSDDLLQTLAIEKSQDLSVHEPRIAALRRCVEELDERQRELVRTAYGSSQSIKQLAELSGRAPQTLYNQLAEIRRALVECVERRMTEGGTG